jgi:DNA-binding response OmpR family regulator
MPTSVLIIDDDPAVVGLLSAALKADGFDVAAVNTSEEGLRRIREQTPHLVIVDLMMAHLDGRQTCNAIRRFSAVPILVLSPLNEPAAVASILDAGADDFLVRPVPTAVLAAHLKRLARRGRPPQPASREDAEWQAGSQSVMS